MRKKERLWLEKKVEQPTWHPGTIERSRLESFLDNVLQTQPFALDPRALIRWRDNDNCQGDQATDQGDHEQGDGDPLPVLITRTGSHKLLKWK